MSHLLIETFTDAQSLLGREIVCLKHCLELCSTLVVNPPAKMKLSNFLWSGITMVLLAEENYFLFKQVRLFLLGSQPTPAVTTQSSLTCLFANQSSIFVFQDPHKLVRIARCLELDYSRFDLRTTAGPLPTLIIIGIHLLSGTFSLI